MSQNPLYQNAHGVMCVLSASCLDIWKVQAIDVLLVSHTHANSSRLHSLCGPQRDSIDIMKKMLRTGGQPHVPCILLSASAEYQLAADSCQPPKLSQITPTNPHIVKNGLYCAQCVTPPLGELTNHPQFYNLNLSGRCVVRRSGVTAGKSSTKKCYTSQKCHPFHIECAEGSGSPAGKAISHEKTNFILLD